MFTGPISCARSTVTVAATARPIRQTLCSGKGKGKGKRGFV